VKRVQSFEFYGADALPKPARRGVWRGELGVPQDERLPSPSIKSLENVHGVPSLPPQNETLPSTSITPLENVHGVPSLPQPKLLPNPSATYLDGPMTRLVKVQNLLLLEGLVTEIIDFISRDLTIAGIVVNVFITLITSLFIGMLLKFTLNLL